MIKITKDFKTGFIIGIVLMIIAQILFGGWGNGIINNYINEPNIVVSETIIFHEIAPTLIEIESSMQRTIKKGEYGFLLASSFVVVESNISHCTLLYGAEIPKGKYSQGVYMSVLNTSEQFSNSCQGCIENNLVVYSNNKKDIENLYGEICWGNSIFVEDVVSSNSNINHNTRCGIIEKEFLQEGRNLHGLFRLKKIDETESYEDIKDYIKNRGELFYSEKISFRDKNHNSLEYSHLKLLVQDIENCRVIEEVI